MKHNPLNTVYVVSNPKEVDEFFTVFSRELNRARTTETQRPLECLPKTVKG